MVECHELKSPRRHTSLQNPNHPVYPDNGRCYHVKKLRLRSLIDTILCTFDCYTITVKNMQTYFFSRLKWTARRAQKTIFQVCAVVT